MGVHFAVDTFSIVYGRGREGGGGGGIENNSKVCGASCIEQGQPPLTALCVHSVSVSCNAPGFD